MHQPINHHWFPKCLMQPWVSSLDSRVESFYRHPAKVASSRKSLKGIGSERNLHTLEALGDEGRNHIELEFQKIEERYAIVRDLIKEDRFHEVTSAQRGEFAFMLWSLPLRRNVRFLDGSRTSTEGWKESLQELIDKNIAQGKINDRYAEDLLNTLGKGIYFDAMLSFCKEMAVDLCKLNWAIFRFNHPRLKLVLSDRPLSRKVDFAGNVTFKMPITPNHLFIASTKLAADQVEYREEFSEILLVKTIGEQFRQASRFVVGVEREPYIKLAEVHMREVDQDPPTGTL
ncbi:DUF4238 domain-containing protein [Aureimonas ureilytica]|uniref:DUF4238 domain-containing protein n=1 Tax=Aureimonas ureilytica TaxID=401562 RepID=UPI0009DC0865|nr:DUF4238 domain-containing protein [Aureimonas ureilytica]